MSDPIKPDPIKRELEAEIHTDLRSRLTYDGYLQLSTLLSAQKPLTNPPVHDEMLFIIQHQTSELWMKLMVHELQLAIRGIQADDIDPCLKVLARVKQVQRMLFEQWAVLETLTPSEYMAFREALGPSSGFQSLQYRKIEFLLGNKNEQMVKVFSYDESAQAELTAILNAPSLYDEFLRFLARKGFAVPSECVEREWAQPHVKNDALIPVFRIIYENTDEYWDAYHLCEQLVDLEEYFQLWRFRHMKTVERIIGFKRGTGGSSGVAFLKRALELTFFPELIEVRTVIGT
jgi:tryptophan 2,3-dioxygenase